MTSRERVLMALNFQETDRAPRDLGAMRSTGISAFAYPRLVDALGLPPRPPRVHDTGQMPALPGVKIFMHNCGALYDLLDLVVESGFDIANPCQWSAGKRSYREWKDKLRGQARFGQVGSGQPGMDGAPAGLLQSGQRDGG
jgi:hypothetical protein